MVSQGGPREVQGVTRAVVLRGRRWRRGVLRFVPGKAKFEGYQNKGLQKEAALAQGILLYELSRFGRMEKITQKPRQEDAARGGRARCTSTGWPLPLAPVDTNPEAGGTGTLFCAHRGATSTKILMLSANPSPPWMCPPRQQLPTWPRARGRTWAAQDGAGQRAQTRTYSQVPAAPAELWEQGGLGLKVTGRGISRLLSAPLHLFHAAVPCSEHGGYAHTHVPTHCGVPHPPLSPQANPGHSFGSPRPEQDQDPFLWMPPAPLCSAAGQPATHRRSPARASPRDAASGCRVAPPVPK